MNNKYRYDFALAGKRIATARKLAGMTQEQVARQLKVGVNHLSQIERGTGGIAIGTLIELAKILNISLDYIVFGEDFRSTPLNAKIHKILPQQKLYLEEMINNFIDCCLDKKCFPTQEINTVEKKIVDNKTE
ncbi:MAG: helix-turn-helix transcriptional regulator [bacterium]|nr:helix-turn-helix transcriptional regulator [bacterium]